MAHPLDGPRHKLGRAEAQLDELDGEIARFLPRDTYEVTQEFDPKSGRCTLGFVVKHPPAHELERGYRRDRPQSPLRARPSRLPAVLGERRSRLRRDPVPTLTDSSDAGFDKWIDRGCQG